MVNGVVTGYPAFLVRRDGARRAVRAVGRTRVRAPGARRDRSLRLQPSAAAAVAAVSAVGRRSVGSLGGSKTRQIYS